MAGFVSPRADAATTAASLSRPGIYGIRAGRRSRVARWRRCPFPSYRTAAPFEGKRVLVVGIGNSAVDIAVDLCRRAEGVTLSTRRRRMVMPKYLMGMPIDRWLPSCPASASADRVVRTIWRGLFG